jgi:hypothetical protein
MQYASALIGCGAMLCVLAGEHVRLAGVKSAHLSFFLLFLSIGFFVVGKLIGSVDIEVPVPSLVMVIVPAVLFIVGTAVVLRLRSQRS